MEKWVFTERGEEWPLRRWGGDAQSPFWRPPVPQGPWVRVRGQSQCADPSETLSHPSHSRGCLGLLEESEVSRLLPGISTLKWFH